MSFYFHRASYGAGGDTILHQDQPDGEVQRLWSVQEDSGAKHGISSSAGCHAERRKQSIQR